MTESRPVGDDEIAATVAHCERAGMTRPWKPPERKRTVGENPDAC